MEIIETNLKFNGILTKRTETNTIVLHHAGADCTIEQVHQWHLANGWAGCGYHFLVRKDGQVYRGRPIDTIGAHAYGGNKDSIGICFEGNFEIETMSDIQVKAGNELVNYIKSIYGDLKLKRHKEVVATLCPGKNFPFEQIIANRPQEQKIKTVIVEKGLYLREEPNTNSKGVLYLKNTTVIVLEENCCNSNGYSWDKVKIRVNNKEGYMANKYLK